MTDTAQLAETKATLARTMERGLAEENAKEVAIVEAARLREALEEIVREVALHEECRDAMGYRVPEFVVTRIARIARVARVGLDGIEHRAVPWSVKP